MEKESVKVVSVSKWAKEIDDEKKLYLFFFLFFSLSFAHSFTCCVPSFSISPAKGFFLHAGSRSRPSCTFLIISPGRGVKVHLAATLVVVVVLCLSYSAFVSYIYTFVHRIHPPLPPSFFFSFLWLTDRLDRWLLVKSRLVAPRWLAPALTCFLVVVVLFFIIWPRYIKLLLLYDEISWSSVARHKKIAR